MSKKKHPRRRSRGVASSLPATPSHAPHAGPSNVSVPERSPLPRLLTIDEVADLLRTSRKAIYAKICRGALPGVVRLPRRLLVDRALLLEWIDEKRAVSLSTRGEQQ